MREQKIEMPTGPEEWPEDKQAGQTDGVAIIQPFKELMRFWPNDQPDREDVQWTHQYEQRYLAPLGAGIAKSFQVDLINDTDYITMPEEARASFLSCVLTRSEIKEVRPGIWEWYPICAVVRQHIVAAVQVQVDRTNQRIEIPRALLWSKQQQEYVPVFDAQTGKIENPAVLFEIFSRYAAMEFGPAVKPPLSSTT